VIHGYLHLLGYDHEVDDGTMRRLQARLASALLPAARR
jgi:ssRNA-specific RNase YbeY (16S rRNA maturation enzyme)